VQHGLPHRELVQVVVEQAGDDGTKGHGAMLTPGCPLPRRHAAPTATRRRRWRARCICTGELRRI
jgi:hypothetical protein